MDEVSNNSLARLNDQFLISENIHIREGSSFIMHIIYISGAFINNIKLENEIHFMERENIERMNQINEDQIFNVDYINVQTTMNSWQTLKKTWYFRSESFKFPLPKNRGKGFTIYGACGIPLKNFVYFEISYSTNSFVFSEFCERLAGELRPEFPKPYLLLDK